MGKMGKFDCKGLKDFQQQLEKLQNPDDFVESCAKELAKKPFPTISLELEISINAVGSTRRM